MVKNQRTWIEISGAALRHNLAFFRRLVGRTTGVMPIVKANAYGHGLPEVLRALRGQPHWGIGVAYGDEALQARTLNYRGRVLVLSNWQASDLPSLIQRNVELVVWDEASLKSVLRASLKSKVRPKIHLKLDTGTTRIGFLESQLETVRQAFTNKSIRVAGLFSHLANAEEETSIYTNRQLQRFTTLRDYLGVLLKNRGVATHIACTAAITRYSEAKFELVRLGIGLYGLSPSDANRSWCRANLPAFRPRPVLSWHTRLAQVKNVPAGTTIGYGSTYRARRKMKIGILPIGYADGFDRRLSNSGYVVVGRHRAPVVGRVCMNLTMVDLSHIPNVNFNQSVDIIGPGVTADDMAETIDTINYEITTRINWSIPRFLI